MTASPKQLSELQYEFDGPIDLFIGSASFESRCLSIATHIGVPVKNAIITRNEPFSAVIEDNFNELSKVFDGRCRALDVTSDDPVATADNLIAAKGELGVSGNVVIDISTFTHETLLILFGLGHVLFSSEADIKFVYAPAGDYSIGEEPDTKWLSKGIREIRSVLGYPGQLVPSKNTHLIILSGYEELRALALIRAFEPSMTSVGYGDRREISTKPHQDTNERKLRRLKSLVGGFSEFVFSCYDPLKVAQTLESIAAQTPNMNIIVAPMNTKVSTLGSAVFTTLNQGAQLCYAQPDSYNFSAYSNPGKDYYLYRFTNYPSGRPW